MNQGDICTVCQSSDFFEQDGQYWCSECNTMSQHVTAILVNQSVYHDAEVDQVVDEAEDAESETRTNTDHKLTSFELYTKVLRGLALELTALGVAPELYKVAKVLWLTYLKKCGIILNEHRQPVLPASINERDIEILYGVNVSRRKIITGTSKTPIKKSTKNRRISCNASLRSKSRDQRKLMQQIALEDEGCATDTSNIQSSLSQSKCASIASSRYSTDFETDDEKIKDIKVTKGGQKFLKKKRANYVKKSDVKRPSLIPSINISGSLEKKKMQISAMDVVSVLWIAVQYTSSSYLQLGDLYRLVVDGYLNLDNLERFLPTECRTFRSFRYFVKHLTRKSFQERCGAISQIMEMVKFRTCDVRLLVRRYVAELALPEAILEYTDRIYLLSQPPEELLVPHSYRMLPEYDLVAIAIILVTLKALFGLDDSTEIELSKVAGKINSHSNSPQPLQFCWTAWSQYIQCRAAVIGSVHNISHDANYSGRIMSHRLAAQTVSDRGIGGCRTIKHQLLGGSKRLKPFLLTGLKSILDNSKAEPLGAPMKPPLAIHHKETYLPQWTQQILSDPHMEIDGKVRHILEQDFRQTSLDYLNPMIFTELCSRLGLNSSVHQGRSPLSPALYNISMSDFIRITPSRTNIPKVEVDVVEIPRVIKDEIDDLDEILAKGINECDTVKNGQRKKSKKSRKSKDQSDTLTLYIAHENYWTSSLNAVHHLHGTRVKYQYRPTRYITRAIGSLCPVNFVSVLNLCASIVRSQPLHLYATMCILEQEVVGSRGKRGKLWPRQGGTRKSEGEEEEEGEEFA